MEKAPLKEIAYYGLHACEALWKSRPRDIRRVYFLKKERESLGAWAEQIAGKGIAVKWVEPQDLEKLTAAIHHQGICFVALEKKSYDFDDWLRWFKPRPEELLLYLDGVGNPHNLGAIVRTAAHFGISTLLGPKGRLPRLTAAATRTAEGGAERVNLVRVGKASTEFLQAVRALNFEVVTTGLSGEEGTQDITKFVYGKRTLLILGAEESGVSEEIASAADRSVTIPGTGAVESLNVSVSAAIFMAEFKRQQGS